MTASEQRHLAVHRVRPRDVSAKGALIFGFRPKPARRVAQKQSDGGPSLFLFRFYEAAVRDLTHPAINGRSRPAVLGDSSSCTRGIAAPGVGSPAQDNARHMLELLTT